MSLIKIISVGKIKEKYIQTGIEEYQKRLSNKRVELIEIKDMSKEKEGEKIISLVEKMNDVLVVALDEHGAEFTSTGFSEFLKKNIDVDICFIVGGPDGLDKTVLERVDKIIAISRMTFTHEMARLFLMEQIYRGLAIIDGKKYHRG
ncbi:MAG: 23S rRNA (pseudouridine(1915)-N(3))-methyltransferase RlmH [Candidatus Aenigmarchaeota archaeon]|nr:23S rRNA (pseudouridine(1915)-N(3))-methyltransferase RlmH [Candidatus Aenigmarchaeota archaeon]MCK5176583.1 23S rRNA (pseudouridine(1915)-N(3))-methyltransferase RlmH [Candidatus Aenigmarchaeota archaeon]